VSLSFLTPVAALVGLVGVLAGAARIHGRRRASALAVSLGLTPPGRRPLVLDLVLIGAASVLVGLAAAQPVVARSESTDGREGSEVIVVFDVTRSMLAKRAPSEPSRLDRARLVAKQLRAAMPETRFGVASLTDRVLPHLFPSLGRNAFVAVVDRAIGIERPPPDRRGRRATAFNALGDLGRTAFFMPDSSRRLAVIMSDGESLPVDLEVLRDRLLEGHVSTIFVQYWRGDEAVFDDNGDRDTAYRPDAASGRQLRQIAGALDSSVYNEGDVGPLIQTVRERYGAGRLVPQGRQLVSYQLAPHALVAALLPLAFVLYRRNLSVT